MTRIRLALRAQEPLPLGPKRPYVIERNEAAQAGAAVASRTSAKS